MHANHPEMAKRWEAESGTTKPRPKKKPAAKKPAAKRKKA
jgi:hypothetical protein